MSRSRDIANIGDDVASGTVLTSASDLSGVTGAGVPDAIDVNASAPADSLAIDASGNVGIGTTSPATQMHIAGDANADSGTVTNQITLRLQDTENVGSGGDTTNPYAAVEFFSSDTSDTARVQAKIGSIYRSEFGDGSHLAFYTSQGGTTTLPERMRIDHSGDFLFAKTSTNDTVGGAVFKQASGGSTPFNFTQTDGTSSGWVIMCNRQGSDGDLIKFRQANSDEGSISVSGSTVSYNGGHLARWSRLADDSKDTSIVKGTVMTNLDAMVEWSHDAVDEVLDEEGNVVTEAKEAYTEDNEQLNKMAVSSVEGDANVAGVFVNWDNGDDFNDMNIAMTGDMVIRIAQGTTVARGDLLMSAGDGTAKPQGDDIVRSKTIAKVTSTHVSHTYDDGSYLVPCVLMAC